MDSDKRMTLGEMELKTKIIHLENRVAQLEKIVEIVKTRGGVLGKMFDARPRQTVWQVTKKLLFHTAITGLLIGAVALIAWIYR